MNIAMIQVNTVDLSEIALDWAVLKARGVTAMPEEHRGELSWDHIRPYSSDWSSCEKLVKELGISLWTDDGKKWFAKALDSTRAKLCHAMTPEQAICLVYVRIKMGDVIEVPVSALTNKGDVK